MNKNEFFRILNENLQGVPAGECTRVNEFYNEYFSDAIDAGKTEEQACNEIERPESIAARVRAEFAFTAASTNPTTKNWGKIVIIVLLAIFASPIAIPIAGAFLAVVVSVLAVMLAVVLSVGAVVVALFFSGLALIGVGVMTLVSSVGITSMAGLILIGVGLAITGFALLSAIGFVYLVRGIIWLCSKIFSSIFSFTTKRRKSK